MLPKYIFEMIIIIFVAGFSVAASFLADDPVNLIPTIGVFGMASIRLMPLARNFSFTLSRIRYSKDTIMKLAADLRGLMLMARQSRWNPRRLMHRLSTPLNKLGSEHFIHLPKISCTSIEKYFNPD